MAIDRAGMVAMPCRGMMRSFERPQESKETLAARRWYVTVRTATATAGT